MPSIGKKVFSFSYVAPWIILDGGWQGVFQENFVAKRAIGCRDLFVQIQKFWNICRNLNFKEDSFYPFPSLFTQNKLRSAAI